MAKLDKMTFARLVAHCVSNGMSAGEYEVNTLDDIISINVEPQIVPGKADAEQVDRLLFLMAQGQQKIEAIKQYRMMTGYGLKEAKDAVERHWVSKPIIEKNEGASLGDILGKALSKD